jgi:hypothetical protein
MSNRRWPSGHDSLLLGFHLWGNQLLISEHTLLETNGSGTNVLEKPADVSSRCLQRNDNIYQTALCHVSGNISCQIHDMRMLHLIHRTNVHEWITGCARARARMHVHAAEVAAK